MQVNSMKPSSISSPTHWFDHPGVSFIVDGAFGSTGKGAASAWLYANCGTKPTVFTTNASPNAGHTAYWRGQKIVTRHLSVGGIIDRIEGGIAITYLNPGAIIDEWILREEIEKYDMHDRIRVSNRATRILDRHKEKHDTLSRIASTQKGTGPAMAERLLRHPDVLFEYKNNYFDFTPRFREHRILCEVPQGFSLGLHSGFYPYTTNRECTVMQGASDLGCSHKDIVKVLMTIRTYPIRVGNTPHGNSGPCYPDQEEITWNRLGVEPEITTVTKRVRRVFTFSWSQYCAALIANKPDAIWVGFMDYLRDDEEADVFVKRLRLEYQAVMGYPMDFMVLNRGPYVEDAQLVW